MGGQYQRQEFDPSDISPSRGTTLYQGFGVLSYAISPTWTFSARAGPAFVQPDSIESGDLVLPSYFAVDPSTCPTRADGTPVLASSCDPTYYLTTSFRVEPVPPSQTLTAVPFVGSQSASSSLNYFGTISTSKQWRQWSVNLNYSRSASNSSGLNGSSASTSSSAR